MGIELSADDRAGMSPAEIEALTGEDAEANLRSHGAEEESAAQRTLDEAAAAAAVDEGRVGVDEEGGETTAAPAEEGAPSLDELAALLADEEAPTPAATPTPVPFKVDDKDFKAERVAVRTKIQEIDDQWSAGTLTDAERKEQLGPLHDQLDDLLAAQVRADTLHEVNEQTAQNQQAATDAQINAACTALMKQAKADKTINYSPKVDPTAAIEFDEFLQAHAKRYVGKSAAFIVAQAHRSMLALRGITPAAAPPPPPGRRDVPTATLSGIPAASPVGMENEALDRLSTLQGEDYEEAFASLPQAEQDRILRAADATAMKFSKGTKRGAKSRAEAEAVE